jgi:hypothetical protein
MLTVGKKIVMATFLSYKDKIKIRYLEWIHVPIYNVLKLAVVVCPINDNSFIIILRILYIQ